MALVYFAGRVRHIIGAEKITAHFAFYIEEDNAAIPIIEYVSNDSICQFRGREGTAYEPNEELKVLLINKDSEQPMLYTVVDFWLHPLVYFLLPLAFWAAFSLSFISKNDVVLIMRHKPYIDKVRARSLKK
jgi:hypothetical protein